MRGWVVAVSDVLLEEGLTFKANLSKGKEGARGGENLKILRKTSFMDGPLKEIRVHLTDLTT